MPLNRKEPLLVALYLPQYYETEYNNEWWGKGYTEWVACKQARALFRGHQQPKVPQGRNYYDLSVKENIQRQMELAKANGIDGFAIYQYYSCGSKLLDVPTEIIRDNPDLDLPFFLFWANESWRKMWFGQDKKIVWEQKYGEEAEWKAQFSYCLTFFQDKRYIRVNDMPVYAIYNAWDIPRVERFIACWNEEAKKAGLKGIYFVKALGRHDNRKLGTFSASVTREPNYSFAFCETAAEKVARVFRSRVVHWLNRNILMPRKKGIVMTKASYDTIWKKILTQQSSSTTCMGAFVDWDNSPRKSYNSIVMTGATPAKFGAYMKQLLQKARAAGSPMIVINAWNEWAEGAYLEPDEANGSGYLEQIRNLRQ